MSSSSMQNNIQLSSNTNKPPTMYGKGPVMSQESALILAIGVVMAVFAVMVGVALACKKLPTPKCCLKLQSKNPQQKNPSTQQTDANAESAPLSQHKDCEEAIQIV